MVEDSSFSPGVAKPTERDYEHSLNPKDFNDFLGQNDLLSPLKTMILATQQRDEVLEHLLFTGQPGLGKTSLALALGNEIGRPLKIISGPALNRAKDLVGILSQLEYGSILFIDEIHRMSIEIEEYLYGAMDRFQIEWTFDSGEHARLLKLDIKPFTLVGATTREALLSPPFRSRFGHRLAFKPYELDAVCQILQRSAKLLNTKLEEPAAALLAKYSRGTPRIANRLLRRARDLAQLHFESIIDLDCCKQTLQMLKIDDNGLEDVDRKVLAALAASEGGRPLGLKNLAVAANEAEDTLAEVIEPWLIRQGFMQRTPQGRTITSAGERALNSSAAND
ncbi:MAG: Holliday junction branch migration DNA helicase RuvB [Planctomycetota bacterium]|nr:Holliday junction branch migration DNA helicase RuvB [Planctomycetota bacterium]